MRAEVDLQSCRAQGENRATWGEKRVPRVPWGSASGSDAEKNHRKVAFRRNHQASAKQGVSYDPVRGEKGQVNRVRREVGKIKIIRAVFFSAQLHGGAPPDRRQGAYIGALDERVATRAFR